MENLSEHSRLAKTESGRCNGAGAELTVVAKVVVSENDIDILAILVLDPQVRKGRAVRDELQAALVSASVQKHLKKDRLANIPRP